MASYNNYANKNYVRFHFIALTAAHTLLCSYLKFFHFLFFLQRQHSIFSSRNQGGFPATLLFENILTFPLFSID